MAEYGIKIKPILSEDQGDRSKFIKDLNTFLESVANTAQLSIKNIGLDARSVGALRAVLESAIESVSPTIKIGKIDAESAIKGADLSKSLGVVSKIKIDDKAFASLNETLTEIKSSLNEVVGLIGEFKTKSASSSDTYISSLEKMSSLLDEISKKEYNVRNNITVKQTSSVSTSKKDLDATLEYLQKLGDVYEEMHNTLFKYADRLKNPFKNILSNQDYINFNNLAGSFANLYSDEKALSSVNKLNVYVNVIEQSLGKMRTAFEEARNIDPSIPMPDLSKVDELKKALSEVSEVKTQTSSATSNVVNQLQSDGTDIMSSDVLSSLTSISSYLSIIREQMVSTFDTSAFRFNLDPIIRQVEELEDRFSGLAKSITSANNAAEKSMSASDKATVASQSSVLRTLQKAVESNVGNVVKNGDGISSVGNIIEEYKNWVTAIHEVITAHKVLTEEEYNGLVQQGSGIQSKITLVNEEIAAIKNAKKAAEEKAASAAGSDEEDSYSLRERVALLTAYYNVFKSIVTLTAANPNMLQSTVTFGDDALSVEEIRNFIVSLDAENLSARELSLAIAQAKEAIADMQRQIADNTSEEKFANNVEAITSKIATLSTNVQNFLNNNSQLTDPLRNELEGIVSSLGNIDVKDLPVASSALAVLSAQFTRIKSEAPQSSAAVDTLDSKIKILSADITSYLNDNPQIVGTLKGSFESVLNSLNGIDTSNVTVASESLASMTAKFNALKTEVPQSASSIDVLDSKIQTLAANVRTFASENPQLTDGMRSDLEDIITVLNSLDPNNIVVSSGSLAALSAQFSRIKAEAPQSSAAIDTLDSKIKILSADITSYLADNPQITGALKDSFESVIGALSGIDTSNVRVASESLNALTAKFSELKTEAPQSASSVDALNSKIQTLAANIRTFISENPQVAGEMRSELEGIITSLGSLDPNSVAVSSGSLAALSAEFARIKAEAPQSSAAIETLESKIKTLSAGISAYLNDNPQIIGSLRDSFDGVMHSLDNIDTSNLKVATDTLTSLSAKFVELKTAVPQSASQIEALNSKIQTLAANVKTFLSENPQITGEMRSELDDIIVKLGSLDANKLSVTSGSLAALSAEFAKIKAEAPQSASAVETLEAKIATLAANINNFIDANPSLSEDFLNRLRGMTDELSSIDATNVKVAGEALAKVKSSFDQVKAESVPTLKETKSAFDELKDAIFRGQVGAQGFVSAMRKIVNEIKQLFEYVKTLDAAMVELEKVTDLTAKGYEKFYQVAVETAAKTGASVSETINAAADFSRLGYNIGDAEELARIALMYKNVGDGIDDVSQSTEAIIATMKAFGLEADNAISIVDKFNETGNNFAISSYGVGEALQRSAAALNAAGNSLDESIGLIVAANNVVQDTVVVGTTMKTISMYLRAAKTELEDAGESTDGMAESTSKLREELLALTGVDIVMPDNETFKSTYQIIKEISAVWSDLSDITQANVTNLIGGKRNANVISALMTNFKDAEAAMKSASDAAGSAEKENAKYLDSITGKLDILQGKIENFANTVIENDSMKMIVDAVGAFVEAITGLVGAASPLGSFLSIVAGLLTAFMGMPPIIARTNGEIKILGASLADIKNKGLAASVGVTGFGKSVSAAFKTIGSSLASTGIVYVISLVISQIVKLIKYISEWRDRIQEAADEASSSVDNVQDATKQFIDLNISVQDGKTTNEQYADSMEEVARSMDGTGRSIDALIAKYGDLDKAIIESAYNTLVDKTPAILKEYNTAASQIVSIGSQQSTYGNRNIGDNIAEEYRTETESMFRRLFDRNPDIAHWISLPDDDTGAFTANDRVLFEMDTPDTIEEVVQAYQSYVDVLREMNETFGYNEDGTARAKDIFPSTYKMMETYVGKMSGYVETYLKDAESMNDLNIGKALYSEMLELSNNDALPRTQEEYDAFFTGIARTLVDNGQIINTETGSVITSLGDMISFVKEYYGYTPRTSSSSTATSIAADDIIDDEKDIDDTIELYKKAAEIIKRINSEEDFSIDEDISITDSLDDIAQQINDGLTDLWYTIDDSGNTVYDAGQIYYDALTSLDDLFRGGEIGESAYALTKRMLYEASEVVPELEDVYSEIGGAVDNVVSAISAIKSGDGQRATYESIRDAYMSLGIDSTEVDALMSGIDMTSMDTNNLPSYVDDLTSRLGQYIDTAVEAGRITSEYGDICKREASSVASFGDSVDGTDKDYYGAAVNLLEIVRDIKDGSAGDAYKVVGDLDDIAKSVGMTANGLWYTINETLDATGEKITTSVEFHTAKILSDAQTIVADGVESEQIDQNVASLLSAVLINPFDDSLEMTEEELKKEIERVKEIINDATSLLDTLSGENVNDVSAYDTLSDLAEEFNIDISNFVRVVDGEAIYNIDALRVAVLSYIVSARDAGYITSEYSEILLQYARDAGKATESTEKFAKAQSTAKDAIKTGISLIESLLSGSADDVSAYESLVSIASVLGKDVSEFMYVINGDAVFKVEALRSALLDYITTAVNSGLISVELASMLTRLAESAGNAEKTFEEKQSDARKTIDSGISLLGKISGNSVDDVSAYDDFVAITEALGKNVDDFVTVIDGKAIYSVDKLKITLRDYIETAVTSNYITREFADILLVAVDNAGKASDALEELSEISSKTNTMVSEGYQISRNSEITLETFQKLIEIDARYAEAVEYVNGKLVLNRQKYDEVTSSILATTSAQLKESKAILLSSQEYQNLIKKQEELTEEEKKRKAQIEAEARAYDVLASEIDNATSAYSRFMNSSDDDSSGRYSQAVKALGVIDDTLNNSESEIYGKVGRNQFKLAVDFVIGENVEVDTDKFEDGLKKAKRYLTDDASGVMNFYNDMVSNGLIDGITGEMDTTIEEISNKLGISAESARALMEELEKYQKTPFDWEKLDSTKEVNNSKDATQTAIDKIRELQGLQDDVNGSSIDIDASGAVSSVETLNSLLGETLTKLKEIALIQVGGFVKSVVKRLLGSSAASGGLVSGKTLVGELGPEIVVDPETNSWHTVGENGPEIVNLKSGSIVLNSFQTKKILGNGINSGAAMAFGSGVAKKDVLLRDGGLKDLITDRVVGTVNINNINVDSKKTTGSSSSSKEAVDIAQEIADKYESINDELEHLIEHQEQLYKVAERGLDYDGMESSLQEQARLYKQIVDNSYAAVEEMKRNGLTDSDKALQDMERSAWSAYNSMYDAFDKLRSLYTDALNKKIDDVQSAFDTLTKASDEFDSSGTISVDTFQELLNNGVEYFSFLENIDGQYEVNADAIKELIKAEKEQLAIESAMSYISRIREALTNGENNELAKLVDVTQNIGDSTWEIVYAQTALLKELGLSDQQYEQILHNIQALRDTAQIVVTEIVDDGDEINKAIDEQTDAVEKILEYTENLVKVETEDRIKAIQKEVDAYKEIIDAKKKSLELTKEENNYEKSVAEKVKEIAELQAKIDQLSLDNSREARAERASMISELAELQTDLADYQAEHAYDVQTEQLDNLATAYEEERQKEIDILEESISSEEKVYRLAIERIASQWDTLYADLINLNYEQGNIINQEITENWNLAIEAVKKYGSYLAALQEMTDKDINEVNDPMPIIAAPKYHSGGVVGSAGSIGDDEVVAILKKGEIVANDEMKKGLYRIVEFQNFIVDKLGSAVQNVFGSSNSFALNSAFAGVSGNVVPVSNVSFNPVIDVVINHSGDMDDAAARSFGERIADTAIGKLYNAFERKGLTGIIGGKLKQ